MKKPLDPDILLLLGKRCLEEGFRKKGNAYFRLLDRNVLQVIKFEHERAMNHYDLRFGLFSMFSPLEKQWFTFHGCIPRYSIVNLKGFPSPVILHECHENNFVSIEVMSPIQQITILEQDGFTFLDSIRTQQELLYALQEMDLAKYGTDIKHDALRIEPYLSVGQNERADRIITANFQQRVGPKAWTDSSWTKQDYAKYQEMGFDTKLAPGVNVDLMEIHNWIEQHNQIAIERYLQENHARNLRFARFLC